MRTKGIQKRCTARKKGTNKISKCRAGTRGVMKVLLLLSGVLFFQSHYLFWGGLKWHKATVFRPGVPQLNFRPFTSLVIPSTTCASALVLYESVYHVFAHPCLSVSAYWRLPELAYDSQPWGVDYNNGNNLVSRYLCACVFHSHRWLNYGPIRGSALIDLAYIGAYAYEYTCKNTDTHTHTRIHSSVMRSDTGILCSYLRGSLPPCRLLV